MPKQMEKLADVDRIKESENSCIRQLIVINEH